MNDLALESLGTVTETEAPQPERFDQWLRTAKAGSIFTYCTAANLGDKSVTDEERATAGQGRLHTPRDEWNFASASAVRWQAWRT
jgi:hypothetical protein